MALIEQEPLLRRLRARYSRVEGGGTIYTPSMMLAIRIVEQAPTIDAAPVVHGRWIDSDEFKGFKMCSACRDCHIGEAWELGKDGRYCPGCGARMDGGEDDG